MRSTAAIRVPGDKSISHRALMLASLASGRSRVRNLLLSADTRATADVLRGLGADIPAIDDGQELSIDGRGLRAFTAPDRVLDCANSGTTARLVCGLIAGQPGLVATLTGDASLRARPMRRVTEPLAAAGASFTELGAEDRLPVRIEGAHLRPIVHDNVRASGQVKSALLLAAVVSGTRAVVREPVPSRDHTERMLEGMGAVLARAGGEGEWTVAVEPMERLAPFDLDVPGDFSSAAFLLAHALLRPGAELAIEHVGVNPTRSGLLPVLDRMGARIVLSDAAQTAGEPVATISARSSSLRGTQVDGREVPSLIDEVPILAVLAARAEGETTIRGAGELRFKETDRIEALAQNLRALGVETDSAPDGLRIRGTDRPLTGRVRTFGDHRIAMAFGVLGALPGNAIELDDPACVDVSFPDFWSALARLESAA